jgi:hypothetical protein
MVYSIQHPSLKQPLLDMAQMGSHKPLKENNLIWFVATLQAMGVKGPVVIVDINAHLGQRRVAEVVEGRGGAQRGPSTIHGFALHERG